MNRYLTTLKNKIFTYLEQALLEIIFLHEMGVSQAEFKQIMPDPYAVHSEAPYQARIISAKPLDLPKYSTGVE